MDEDVQPVEDDIGNLGSEAKKLKKVGSISKTLSGILLAKFVDDKILWIIINECIKLCQHDFNCKVYVFRSDKHIPWH